MTRLTTFVSYHTSHPWSKHRVLVWLVFYTLRIIYIYIDIYTYGAVGYRYSNIFCRKKTQTSFWIAWWIFTAVSDWFHKPELHASVIYRWKCSEESISKPFSPFHLSTVGQKWLLPYLLPLFFAAYDIILNHKINAYTPKQLFWIDFFFNT